MRCFCFHFVVVMIQMLIMSFVLFPSCRSRVNKLKQKTYLSCRLSFVDVDDKALSSIDGRDELRRTAVER